MSDVAHDQLRAFVDRILRLKEEGRAINTDVREVYAEAKGNGFDKTALGKLVSYIEKRNSDSNAQAESEALFDLYLSAYDGAKPSHVHAYARGTDNSEPQSESGMLDDAAQTVQPLAVVASVAEPEAVESSAPISEPMTTEPPPKPVVIAAGDRGADSSPVATVVPIRSHNPETHFLSEKGLARLHGCIKPEVCASSQPRVRLCFDCSIKHDGPTQNGEVA